MVNSTIADLVAKEDRSYDALLGSLDRWVAKTVDWEAIKSFSTLGVDEIALTKGHRNFVAVLSAAPDSGHLQLLAILPDRLTTTLVTWLTSMPAAMIERITTVGTDRWEGSGTAVQEVLPNATMVIDRFLVARHDRDGVATLRKQEITRGRAELPPEQQADLKRTLWPLRQREQGRSEEEQAQLERLFAHSPALESALGLREPLTTIVETARSRRDGLRRIRLWCARVKQSGLTCFDTLLALLDTWGEPIANDFIDYQTSGLVEGLNHTLTVLKRRCYGIRATASALEAASSNAGPLTEMASVAFIPGRPSPTR